MTPVTLDIFIRTVCVVNRENLSLGTEIFKHLQILEFMLIFNFLKMNTYMLVIMPLCKQDSVNTELKKKRELKCCAKFKKLLPSRNG